MKNSNLAQQFKALRLKETALYEQIKTTKDLAKKSHLLEEQGKTIRGMMSIIETWTLDKLKKQSNSNNLKVSQMAIKKLKLLLQEEKILNDKIRAENTPELKYGLLIEQKSLLNKLILILLMRKLR